MKKRLLNGILALLLSVLLFGCKTGAPETGSQAAPGAATAVCSANAAYAGLLFDRSYVHAIDVEIDPKDWADLCENPLQKTKYAVNVTVDGESFVGVSFATKGNTSLSSVASDPDSNRYSFKINFGKYNKQQSYHGLDKLNLNNLYSDATYMKDYISYRLFEEAGVYAPLTSYVRLTINGQAHGLYLAIEDIGKSFLNRTAGGEGALYKPETSMLNNDNMANGPQGDAPDGQPPEGFSPQEESSSGGGDASFPPADGQNRPPQMNGPQSSPAADESSSGGQGQPQGGAQDESASGGGEANRPPTDGQNEPPQGGFPGGFDGFGGGAKGADLAYIDDEIESYPDIFDNAETDVGDAEKRRVVAALKALSEQSNVSDYLNTNEIIRYFAAHNFVLNYDSYTGTLLHNYYLYEHDGRLSMMPWDYNLAFGGFGGGENATQLVNTGIDTPLSGASVSSRPMWAWIADSETYTAQYHAVYDALLEEYFESGAFAAEIDALAELLLPYIEQDPSAFFTAEQYRKAWTTLKSFCLLRAESIRKQLTGTLSCDTQQQTAEARVDASALSIDVMGEMGGAQGPGPDRKEPQKMP